MRYKKIKMRTEVLVWSASKQCSDRVSDLDEFARDLDARLDETSESVLDLDRDGDFTLEDEVCFSADCDVGRLVYEEVDSLGDHATAPCFGE